MKNKVGPPVSGDDFFKRPGEIRKIWRAIEAGTHILMSAPRRIGKTSILYYLLDTPKDNYHCIYIITQSVENENDYYKRLYKAIVAADSFGTTTIRIAAGTKEFLSNLVKKVKNVTH